METAKKTLLICTIIVAFTAILYFIVLSNLVILYLVVATLLVFAINPVVTKLEKWGASKVWAAVIADIFLLIIVLGLLGTIAIPLINQGMDLFQHLPEITNRMLNNPSFVSLNQKFHFADTLKEFSNEISVLLLGGGTSLIVITNNVISKLVGITSVIVLTFLLQIEGLYIWKGFLSFLKEKDASIAERVGSRIQRSVSGFVSGNLFISLIAGLVTLITLWILGVPYKFALAVLVALFDLIPLVGAAIATIIVGLVALTQGIFAVVISVVVLLVYQFVEGHFIQPAVYSHSIDLSALLIVVASIIGGEIGGITGILLAIPAAAVVQIVATEIYDFFKEKKVS